MLLGPFNDQRVPSPKLVSMFKQAKELVLSAKENRENSPVNNLIKLFEAVQIVEMLYNEEQDDFIRKQLGKCFDFIKAKIDWYYETLILSGKDPISLKESMAELSSGFDKIKNPSEKMKAMIHQLQEEFNALSIEDFYSHLCAHKEPVNKFKFVQAQRKTVFLKVEEVTKQKLMMNRIFERLLRDNQDCREELPSIKVFSSLIKSRYAPSHARREALRSFISNTPDLDGSLYKTLRTHFFINEANDHDPRFNPFSDYKALPFELSEILKRTVIEITKQGAHSYEVETIINKSRAVMDLKCTESSLTALVMQMVCAEKGYLTAANDPDKRKYSDVIYNLRVEGLWCFCRVLIQHKESAESLDMKKLLALATIPVNCKNSIAYVSKMLRLFNQLFESGFLDELFKAIEMHEKYDEICQFKDEFNAQKRLTDEVKALLDFLKDTIMVCYYEPVNNLMYELGGNTDATLEVVFKSIDEKLDLFWGSIKNEKLKSGLNASLDSYKNDLKSWSLLRGHDPRHALLSDEPLFYEVVTHKYSTANPNASAVEAAASLGLNLNLNLFGSQPLVPMYQRASSPLPVEPAGLAHSNTQVINADVDLEALNESTHNQSKSATLG